MAKFSIQSVYRMRLVLVCLLTLTLLAANAQKMTLEGTVVDGENNEPLPYASVYIKGKSVGTITNLQGEFAFHFPSEYRNEILVISMLGYGNFEAPIWSVLDDHIQKIVLKPSTFVLDEVVVVDSLSAAEIFRMALDRIDQNFPMQPFLMDGFYRDVKKVGGTYIALLEAAVKIYDENYEEPRNKAKLRERVKLVEVRKSLGYENNFTTYFGQKNLLEDLLLHNTIRYRQVDAQETLLTSLKREKDSYYNGHEIVVLSCMRDFFLKVFIDKKDYSIVHLEFQVSTKGDALAKRKNMVSKQISYKKTIDFRSYNGKMFLNYITVTSKERWYESGTDVFKFETELQQYLLINEIHANTQQRIGSTERMRNYGLQYQDYPYNKEFWDNYNVIKETPLDKTIRVDLETLAPLEKQFEEN
jgi:hypothetical protein